MDTNHSIRQPKRACMYVVKSPVLLSPSELARQLLLDLLLLLSKYEWNNGFSLEQVVTGKSLMVPSMTS